MTTRALVIPVSATPAMFFIAEPVCPRVLRLQGCRPVAMLMRVLPMLDAHTKGPPPVLVAAVIVIPSIACNTRALTPEFAGFQTPAIGVQVAPSVADVKV